MVLDVLIYVEVQSEPFRVQPMLKFFLGRPWLVGPKNSDRASYADRNIFPETIQRKLFVKRLGLYIGSPSISIESFYRTGLVLFLNRSGLMICFV